MVDKTLFFRRIKFIFWIIVYYSIIVYYGHYIEDKFEYVRGFHNIGFNFYYYCLNLIPLFLYSLLFPLNMKYVSDYIVFFMILLVNIPVGYFLLLKTDDFLLAFLVMLLNFSWFFLWRAFRTTFILLPQIKIALKELVFIALLIVILYFLWNSGLSFKFHEKREIYRIRTLFKERDWGIVLKYLFSLMQYSIIPVLVMIAVSLKSKLLKGLVILTAVIITISIFSVTALKSALFVLVFVFIGYLISKFKVYNPVTLLAFVSVAILFLIWIHEYNAIFEELYTHTMRRVFYTPSKTGTLAYEYFTLHCDSCGYFGGLGDNIGHRLSLFYFGTEGNSTTGFLANSILNKGIFRTFLDIGLLIITLKAIDSVTRSIPVKYGLIVFIVYGYVLSNTALSSTLFSYGLILSLLMVSILKKWIQKRS